MRKWMTVLALAIAGAGCIGEEFDAGGEAGGSPGEEPASTDPPGGDAGGGEEGEAGHPEELRAEGNGLACSAGPLAPAPTGAPALALLAAAALLRRRGTS
jgi:uncharacterized protein (TIGR03382 family)